MTRINSYYLSEIDKIPLLTLEEEKALATKAFSGDKSAQKNLHPKGYPRNFNRYQISCK